MFSPPELIQTELHHVQTLKIMTNLFRKGMLEDLQMDAAQVQSMFPCVDELSEIHDRFLVQLLERRKASLATDSNKNFVISRLGDILVQQVSFPSPPSNAVMQLTRHRCPGCSGPAIVVPLPLSSPPA